MEHNCAGVAARVLEVGSPVFPHIPSLLLWALSAHSHQLLSIFFLRFTSLVTSSKKPSLTILSNVPLAH
jgi:hypothetical protein